MDVSSGLLGALNLRCSSPTSSLFHCLRSRRGRLLPRPFLLSDLITTTNGRNKKEKNNYRTTLLRALCSSSFVIGDADYYSNGIGGAASDVTRGKLLQVVLVSPQIAGNTGSIARTCAASAVALHLVEPLGYKIDDTKLKRAGLDYWPYVVVKVHASWADFLEYFRRQAGEKRLLAFTKKGTSIHSDVKYKQGDWLVFGSEVSGLPPEALVDCTREGMGGGTVKIPMVDTYVRCLNLSVSVGIALYEASRQLNYEQLQCPDAGVEGQRPFISEDAFG